MIHFTQTYLNNSNPVTFTFPTEIQNLKPKYYLVSLRDFEYILPVSLLQDVSDVQANIGTYIFATGSDLTSTNYTQLATQYNCAGFIRNKWSSAMRIDAGSISGVIAMSLSNPLQLKTTSNSISFAIYGYYGLLSFAKYYALSIDVCAYL